MTNRTKYSLEIVAGSAALITILAFLTGHAKLSELLPKRDVWYAAALTNDSDDTVGFSVFHADRNIWGLRALAPHARFTFTELNHPIHVMIQGDMIIRTESDGEHVQHTYRGKECYVLHATTFNHAPSEEEGRVLESNRFTWIIGGGAINGPDGKGLPTFIPNGVERQLSIFEDPDMPIWAPKGYLKHD